MDRAFEARDLVKVMDEAVNYNRFLLEELAAWAKGLRRILDFGAGNGRFARGLQSRGLEVHAIEPDPLLRQEIVSHGVVAHESLESLVDPGFDGVYSINVVEHLENDRAVLRAFHRCLRPDGRLLLYVPAFGVLFSANDKRVGHLQRYRKSTLLPAVLEAGFEVEKATYVDSLGFASALGYRLFGSRDGGLGVGAMRFYDTVLFPLSRFLDRALGRAGRSRSGEENKVVGLVRATDRGGETPAGEPVAHPPERRQRAPFMDRLDVYHAAGAEQPAQGTQEANRRRDMLEHVPECDEVAGALESLQHPERVAYVDLRIRAAPPRLGGPLRIDLDALSMRVWELRLQEREKAPAAASNVEH